MDPHKVLEKLESTMESMSIESKYKKKIYFEVCESLLKETEVIDILKQLKAANKQRQDDWKKTKPNATDWDLPAWGNAVAGETGEMCNVIKKIHRGDFENNKEEGIEKLASEAADVVCYLDLLCQKAGIDLRAAIVNKFNEKSEEIGSEVKIYYY